MKNDTFPHKQPQNPSSGFDFFAAADYPFKEAKLHLPGVPPWWLKTDAGSGILLGDGVSGKHTHAYIHSPGEETVGFGAHLKEEATGRHLYSFKPSRWLLREDLAAWAKWLGESLPDLLFRLLPELETGIAFRSIDQILKQDPWGRKAGWRPIQVGEMIRSFERRPGVIVVDEAGIQRMIGLIPLISTPEMFIRSRAPEDKRTPDVAFLLPLQKEFLAFLLRELLAGDRQRILVDPDDSLDNALSSELFSCVRWALKALENAGSGPLYLAIRGDNAERWLRIILEWSLRGAVATFRSKDMKEYWESLLQKVKSAKSLADVDWSGIICIDLPKLFGSNGSTGNESTPDRTAV